jgi:F-type H+-transporting ATPase subunit epsilon
MIISFRSLDRGVIFEGEAMSLNVKTTSGEITVLDCHRPLMTELRQGNATVVNNDGAAQQFEIAGGFLEVNRNNQVLLLVD